MTEPDVWQMLGEASVEALLEEVKELRRENARLRAERDTARFAADALAQKEIARD